MTDIRTPPDPQWASASSICTGCSYSLEGLVPPIPCPECGTVYESQQFIIHGVPTARSTTPWPLLALAILALIALQFLPQVIVIAVMTLGMYFGITALLVTALVVVVICILVVRTSKRRRAGVCQLIFMPRRLTCHPIKTQPEAESLKFTNTFPFTGTELAVIIPVGLFWAKLRIEHADGKRLFQAGIRCPKAHIPAILDTLNALIRGDHNLWQSDATGDTIYPMATQTNTTTTTTQTATHPG